MKRLFLVLFIALVFRLIISPWPLHVDLLSHAEWGEQIFKHGTKGFYEQSIWTYSWPTQPPLASYMNGLERNIYQFLLELFRNIGHTIVKYHLAPWYMRWWFAFTIWFDQAKYSVEVGYPIGYFMSIKLLPILADLGIATVLYKVAKKKSKKPLLWSTIYLFSPFSWYLSSLWGQNDQISFLFLLLAFFFESQRRLPVLTPLLFAISVALKPTSLIFSPFFLFVYLKNHHKKVNWLFRYNQPFGIVLS